MQRTETVGEMTGTPPPRASWENVWDSPTPTLTVPVWGMGGEGRFYIWDGSGIHLTVYIVHTYPKAAHFSLFFRGKLPFQATKQHLNNS